MKTVKYINIQGWMIGVLNLKGNELLIYAIIYGFSQDDKTKYKGSLSYISQGIKISKRSCINSLSNLEKKNLIIKHKKLDGNEYQYNSYELQQLIDGSEKSAPVKKVHTNSEKSAPVSSEKNAHNNNNYNNINNNTIDFNKLLNYLNEKTGKKARVVNSKVKKAFGRLLKEGYLKEDIVNAINCASKNNYHIENNFQYLNIEFFSRSSTIDKYGYNNSQVNKTNSQSTSTSDQIPVG